MTDFVAARRHMVDGQLLPNRVTSHRILDAMADIPRERFLPESLRGIAYMDEDLALGRNRSLMSPMVLARLIQAADPGPRENALDVGTATGYAAAVLARLAGSVVALEEDQALSDQAARTLNELAIDNATAVTGPLADGYPTRAPYGVILVNGAVDEVPERLLAQLAEGGRLVTVIGTGPVSRATLMIKRAGVVSARVLFDAWAAPLHGFARTPGFVF
jgi:protein-L-isoaspartate(D-aspartate) O-methyltransferase